LQDRFLARQWLRQFKGDAIAIRDIRDLLSHEGASGTLSRMTDDDLIAQMANVLNYGFWHVHPQPVVVSAGGSSGAGKQAEEPEPAPEARRAPARAGSPEVLVPVEEAASLPGTADEAAIAATLKRASEQGIPFCEECMKAALKNAQQGGARA
jgi:hypothetical protein